MLTPLKFTGTHEQREAKALLLQVDDESIRWTPMRTLEITVCPASAAGHFHGEMFDTKTLAPTLSEKSVTVREDVRDNKTMLLIEGEGAVDVARTLRDELGKNFIGCASLPRAAAIAQ